MSPEALPEPEGHRGDWAHIGSLAARFLGRVGQLGNSACRAIARGSMSADESEAQEPKFVPNIAPEFLSELDQKDLVLLDVIKYPHEFNRIWMMAQSKNYDQSSEP